MKEKSLTYIKFMKHFCFALLSHTKNIILKNG